MVTDIRLRNLYAICCGVFLAATAFMTWLDYQGTTLSGLDTEVGPLLIVIGAGVVVLSLHQGFGQEKAGAVAIAGLVASLLALSFGQRLAWTGTTFWPAVAIGVGLVLVVIGLSGVLLPGKIAPALEEADVE